MGANVRLLRNPRAWGFVFAVVLVSQLVPAASHAAATGSITGSVENGGSATPNICVDVFEALSGNQVAHIETDANGMYTADDLPAGDYKVLFTDCHAPDDFAPEWNGGGRDQSLAPPVTVAVGATVQVDAELDRWGAVTGSVENGGSAIPDICVRVFDQHGASVGWSRTDANGMYTVKIRSLLGIGNYNVRFKDCVVPYDFAPEWNDGIRLLRHRLAQSVVVTIGYDTVVNATLERWPAISGTVTDETSGQRLADICVKVFRRFGNRAILDGGWGRTGPNGTYMVEIRKPYVFAVKVRFSDCITPRGYVTEFYDNHLSPWRPTMVGVRLGHTTSGIDAALAQGGGGGGGGGGGSVPPPPVLRIASFAPTVGPVGIDVSIDGSGFTGATGVSFNGVASSFTVNSDTHITATVPDGASAGVISVTTANGTTRSVGTFAVSHGRHVNLRLSRSLFASGTVRVTDGFGMCRRRVSVAIQRYTSGSWHLVKKGVTDAHGAFRIKMHGLTGRFRAILREVTLGTGDICEASASRPTPSG